MVIIRKNFGLKVLSLALAIVGWAYFRFATNPVLASRFDQQISVPIVAAHLPAGFVAHYTAQEAVVTVEAKRDEPAIKPDDIKAVLDLSEIAGRGEGGYNVPVQLVAPNVQVQSLSPASVSLVIEKIDDRTYPVLLHYSGQPSTTVVVSGSALTPPKVIAHGESGLLQQVAAIRVDVPLPQSPSDFDSMVRPVPVNAAGEEVANLTVSPDLVRVQVHFVKGSGETPKP